MIEQQSNQIAARISGCARDYRADPTAHVFPQKMYRRRVQPADDSINESLKLSPSGWMLKSSAGWTPLRYIARRIFSIYGVIPGDVFTPPEIGLLKISAKCTRR